MSDLTWILKIKDVDNLKKKWRLNFKFHTFLNRK